MSENKNKIITYANFSNDGSHFAIATDTGFKIYKTSNSESCLERNLEERIKLVEIYENSNICAFTGNNANGKYHDNNVYIWDDSKEKVVSILRFCNIVQRFKFKKDRLIVSTDKKIYLFEFPSMKFIEIIENVKNQYGIFALCNNPKLTNIAYIDDSSIGSVVVRNFINGTEKTIAAHNSAISYLSLSYTGLILATASQKGTVVKLFNTVNGELLQELRRGKDIANISNISFSKSSNLLVVSSNKETVHIFSLSSIIKKLKDTLFLSIE